MNFSIFFAVRLPEADLDDALLPDLWFTEDALENDLPELWYESALEALENVSAERAPPSNWVQ